MAISGGYHAIRDRLIGRLDETAPGRVQILTGPRQGAQSLVGFKQSVPERHNAEWTARHGFSQVSIGGKQRNLASLR